MLWPWPSSATSSEVTRLHSRALGQVRLLAAALMVLLASSTPTLAQSVGCIPPVAPFVSSDPRDVQAYADLIRGDFEAYIADFEGNMRCLDVERERAFEEGQTVIQEYGRFQQISEHLRSPDPAG